MLQMPTRVNSKISSSGYINIIFQLVKEANLDVGNTPLEIAEIRQWIEYGLIYLLHTESAASLGPTLKVFLYIERFYSYTSQILLQELNNLLSIRTYLVSHKLSVADIFIFYLLQNTMVCFNTQNLSGFTYFDLF